MTPSNQTNPRISITLHPRGKNSVGENRQRLKHSAFHWGVLVSPGQSSTSKRDPSSKSRSGSRSDSGLRAETVLNPSQAHEHGQMHVHFDVTDSLHTDPITGKASQDWRYRERTLTSASEVSDDPVTEFKILAMVVVGTIPSSSRSRSLLSRLLSGLRLNSDHHGVDLESGLERVRRVLSVLPVPCPRGEVGVQGKGGSENCVSWTRGAITVLREEGVLEMQGVDVDEFMDDALRFADECLEKGRWRGVLDYRTGRR